MIAKVFLIVDRDGNARMTKRSPYLDRGEIALRLTVNIPNACFTAPIVDVVLDVPADRVETPQATIEIVSAEAG
jgi:hypothetical protein